LHQLHKRPFAGLLSRSGTDKSLHRGFARTDTASSSLSASVSSLSIVDDKGPLGLITLYEPPPSAQPVADIVFIHGLGGGSRKTWSYSSQPHHYWPRSWLPADNDFSDVRIHTFGYKADWGERRESILDIHDFAQSLLGALRNHPGIRRTATRIIFVGHSMGGCVAKKAYILARQDPTAADLAGRVQSIFFLATPHRGSDMASILENMLAMAWGKKPYVTDLTPNSAALTAINDAFRHFAPELRLWSFYETLPIRGAATMSRIVVDRHSATLGYHNEEIAGLDADHRHVCKFDTADDPNYKTLRNALHTALDMIREAAGTTPVPLPLGVTPTGHSTLSSKPFMSSTEVTSRLRSFLRIRTSPESDLATLQALKQPGSCEWFTAKTCFSSWRAGTTPGILWLAARPAAGKSVIASHVIEQLSPPHAYCSYFICKHSKGSESTLSDCLRSLAFQMAMQDDFVKDALLQLAQDDFTWDTTDEASVWRRLFTGCIFKTPCLTQHFWVIDGVDECANFNALFAKRLLASLPQELRLFATSRNLEEIERGLAPIIPSRAFVHLLSDEDTAEDMRLFLTMGLMELGRPDTPEDRKHMCDMILQKSSGSFLWARLVLQEFENAWTEEAMFAVLREIPPDLFELYSRMAESVAQDPRKLTLAKSILTWVVLARRPLMVDELRCAVKLDINQTLQNATKAIPDLCGQLVFVDQHDRVQMIHDTAREFLLTENSALAISIQKKHGHTRLASLLLRYLSGAALNPWPAKSQQNPGRARGFAKQGVTPPSGDTSLLEYACTSFSEHVYRASSADHQVMGDLSEFLSVNNFLSWIEYVARSGDLTPLARAAVDLREYIGRRMKYVPPTDRSMQLVDGWVTDLIRVAAKFRAELLACPSSIHSLIPPLCPSESVISRTFGKESRLSPTSSGLIVRGLSPGSWDDCLIRMDFQKGQTTALSHGDRFFAIGLSTGQISLYDPTSLQVLRRFIHPERVNILEFSPDSEDVLLASCGTKQLAVWDTKSGTILHSFPLLSPPLAITFLGLGEVLGAFKSCTLTKWYVKVWTYSHQVCWQYRDTDSVWYLQEPGN
jgi:pimeloyl-ACP methyl ester carboxylesterase